MTCDHNKKIVVLTGPPAGGKSTVCSLFEDIGVPTIGTGDGIRMKAREQYNDPDEDQIWQVAEDLRDEHGPAGPTIACQDEIDTWFDEYDVPFVVVSDLREQAEVDWIQDRYGQVLVIRVDTCSRATRIRRYVDREVGNLGHDDAVPYEREQELRQEIIDREKRESPYPDHHVTLLNEDDVHMDELMCRLQGLCNFVDDEDHINYRGIDCGDGHE